MNANRGSNVSNRPLGPTITDGHHRFNSTVTSLPPSSVNLRPLHFDIASGPHGTHNRNVTYKPLCPYFSYLCTLCRPATNGPESSCPSPRFSPLQCPDHIWGCKDPRCVYRGLWSYQGREISLAEPTQKQKRNFQKTTPGSFDPTFKFKFS